MLIGIFRHCTRKICECIRPPGLRVMLIAYAVIGCSGSSSASYGTNAAPGTSGGPCVDGNLCDYGLTCVANVCKSGSWGEAFDGAPPGSSGSSSRDASTGSAGSMSGGATGSGGTTGTGAIGSGGAATGARSGRGGTFTGSGGSVSGSGGTVTGSGGVTSGSGGVLADGSAGGALATGGTTAACLGQGLLLAGPRKGQCPNFYCQCSDPQYSAKPCFSMLDYATCCSTGACP